MCEKRCSLLNPYVLTVLLSITFNKLHWFYYRELAEMLDNLKCINLLKLPKSDEKCSLFSKPMVSETENAGILDEATDIIVEPATDAMLKLATFTNHAAQHLVCPCHTEWKNEKSQKIFEKCQKFAMVAKKRQK